MADAVNRDWRRRRANNTVNLSHTTHGVEGFDQLVALVTELTAHVNALKLRDVEREIGWMYETLHSDGKTKGRIEFTVWSEIFTCPECAGEVNFIAEALDDDNRTLDSFSHGPLQIIR